MNFTFDDFDRYEIPVITLCNPSWIRKTVNGTSVLNHFDEIGVIQPLKQPSLSLRFNSISELTFKVSQDNLYYNEFKKNRIIHLQKLGYWIINTVQENYDGTKPIKEIKCFSEEYNFSSKAPNIEAGTYYLYQQEGTTDRKNIFSLISQQIQPWVFSIDGISSLSEKQRTFDLPTNNLYTFLTTDVSEAYECIFDFDVENHIINVYDIDSAKRSTDIILSWSNLLKQIQVAETSDNICTVLGINGSNDFDISCVNPLGTNQVFGFDYYKNWMPNRVPIGTPYYYDNTLTTLVGYTTYEHHADIVDYNNVEYYTITANNNTYYISGTNSGLWYRVKMWQDEVLRQMFSTNENDFPYLVESKANASTDLLSLNSYKTTISSIKTSAQKIQAGYTSYTINNVSSVALNSILIAIYGYTSDRLEEICTHKSNTYPCIDFNIDGAGEIYPSDLASYILTITGQTGEDGVYCQTVANVLLCSRLINGVFGSTIDVDGVGTGIVCGSGSSIQTRIDNKQAEIDSLDSSIATIQESLAWTYENPTGIRVWFTDDEIVELNSNIYESEYTNQYCVLPTDYTFAEKRAKAQELLQQGLNVFNRMSQVTYTFSLESVNFLFVKKYQKFINQLSLGCLINVEIQDGDWVTPILLQIDFDYENPDNFSLEFGNRYRLQTSEYLFSDLYEQATSATNAVTYAWSGLIAPVNDNLVSVVQELLNGALDVAKNNVLMGENQEMKWDSNGLWGREWDASTSDYDPRQFRITNRNLVFTDNNWQTAGVAIGCITITDSDGTIHKKMGTAAELLLGELIVGSELTISTYVDLSENPYGSTFSVNSSGVKLNNIDLSIQRDDTLGRITMDATSGIKMQKRDSINTPWTSNDGITDMITFDILTGSTILNGSLTAVADWTNYSLEDVNNVAADVNLSYQNTNMAVFAQLSGQVYYPTGKNSSGENLYSTSASRAAFSAGYLAQSGGSYYKKANTVIDYEGKLTTLDATLYGALFVKGTYTLSDASKSFYDIAIQNGKIGFTNFSQIDNSGEIIGDYYGRIGAFNYNSEISMDIETRNANKMRLLGNGKTISIEGSPTRITGALYLDSL